MNDNGNHSQQIVNKAKNYAHVLRDDGLSYLAYTEQITFPFHQMRTATSMAGTSC